MLPTYGGPAAIESTPHHVRRIPFAYPGARGDTLRPGGSPEEGKEADAARATNRGVDPLTTIAETVASEFSDIPDLAQLTRVTMRLLLAALLGGVLGFERAQSGKSAGLRTHMLVALGASLFVLVPLQAGVPFDSVTRVLQGVIAGIGFLCAGTILKSGNPEHEHIHGLTTAAGVWLTAAIGVTVGMGHEATAVLSTAIAFFILSWLGRLERRFENRAD